MKSNFFFSIFFTLFLFGCVPGNYSPPVEKAIAPPFYHKNIYKLAILVNGGTVREKKQVESGATQALMIHNYAISSRADLKSLVQEISFQQSGFSDSDGAKFGKILNVPAVLVFSFESKRLDNNFKNYSLNARLIDVETGEVLFIARGDDRSLEEIAFSLSFEIPPASGIAMRVDDNNTGLYRHFGKVDWRDDLTIAKMNGDFSKYKKVAVLVDSRDKQFQSIAEDTFMMSLIGQGVTVSSRSDLDLVVKEIKFQHSGLTDNMSVRAGEILNVPAVVIVSIKKYRKDPGSRKDGSYYDGIGIMAKVIDIETGEIIIMSGKESTFLERSLRMQDYEWMLKGMARKVAGSFN